MEADLREVVLRDSHALFCLVSSLFVEEMDFGHASE